MAKIKDRYAEALLELSEEKGTLEQDLEQAILVRDALSEPDVNAFLKHPKVSNTDKFKIFKNAFSEKLSKHLFGFLNLMVIKNRESIIVPALTEYIERANRRLGKIEAKVVSAKELTDKQLESIRNILSRKFDMQVVINSKVDPDVIGGFYILVDGWIYDRTIRAELNNMKESLKRGVMNDS